MLSIVIPAYNEEARLQGTLKAVEEHFAGRKHEVIVIDDGSLDATAIVAERSDCQVVKHSCNLGKGAAVKSGVLASRGNMVLVMDADLAVPLAEFSKLETALKRDTDLAAGSRSVPEAAVMRSSWKRKLAGKIFSILVRSLTGLPYRDTQCGFKLFRGDIARTLFRLARCRGYCFEVEILILAQKLNLQIREVGIEWHDRPGSKVQLIRDSFRMLRDLLIIRRRFAVATSPAIHGTSVPEKMSSPAS